MKWYAEQLYGRKGFFRKLFCFHPYWKALPVADWRWAQFYRCEKCYKIKAFAYNYVPVNFANPKQGSE